MREPAIIVSELSKMYRIGASKDSHSEKRLNFSSWKSYLNFLSSLREKQEIIWALRKVSFTIHHGEIVSIIGPNGAGKSTLLKLLSRVTEPTEGSAQIYGRVGSLLEVSTGFHPELTGRENIYLKGSIMGMKKYEIIENFQNIIDFSGIGRLLDTPVKRYSSGMYLRLAFAVAVNLLPEILIVDEVLSVGDASFRKKSIQRMSEIVQSGCTILLVSHNMDDIRALAKRSIWIDGGRLVMDGSTEEVIRAYLANEKEEERII